VKCSLTTRNRTSAAKAVLRARHFGTAEAVPFVRLSFHPFVASSESKTRTLQLLACPKSFGDDGFDLGHYLVERKISGIDNHRIGGWL
jgi:hypothetical protein